MSRLTKTSLELVEEVFFVLNTQRVDTPFQLSELPFFTVEALPPLQDACVSNWVLKIEPCSTEVAAALRHAATVVQHEFDLRDPA
jgi:hypothetical protein